MMKSNSFLTIVLGLIYSAACFAQNTDSVWNSLGHLGDSSRVDSFVKIARYHVIHAKGSLALPYSKKAYEESKRKGFNDLIPKAHFYMAAAFLESNVNDSAIVHYEKSLEEMKGTAIESWKFHVYSNIPWLFQNQGNYKKALEYQFKGLSIAEENKDTINTARFMTEIGYSYDRMRAYEQAIDWHKKSLPLFYSKDQMDDYYYVISRIGIAFDDLNVFDSAHLYNRKALQYFLQIKDSINVAEISSNIGNTYLKQEQWEQALDLTSTAYRYKSLQSNYPSTSITATNLGLIYWKLGKYVQAKSAFLKAIYWSNKAEHLKSLSEAYEGMYLLYQELGVLDSSIFYFQQMDALEDSIYQLQRAKQMTEMQVLYETEKKEKQIALKDAELAIKENLLLSRQRLIIVLLLLIIIVAMTAAWIYQRYRRKKEKELQQFIIKEQEKGIEAVFYAQEEERKRISKELHDGIGQQLSGVKMAFQKLSRNLEIINPQFKQQMDQLSHIVSDSADEVRSISHQMMPKALVELGLIQALEDMLSKSLSINGIEYEFEHYGINDRLEEKVEVSIYRVAQELINNIIKHSGSTQVNLQLFKNAKKLVFIVEDNGKGWKDTKGEGHGLLNMKSRINSIKGELNLEPSPGSGTLATIRIPIH